MPRLHRRLSREEIAQAMAGSRPVMTLAEVSDVLGVPLKTLHEWLAKGRLRNCARRRGKRYLIWRDRLIDDLFNGADWIP